MVSGAVQEWGFVLYNDPAPLYHQRRILGRVATTDGTESMLLAILSSVLAMFILLRLRSV